MKIIEALKELPLIEKKIRSNQSKIQQYASYATHVGPEFVDADQQKREVDSLVQSNKDLLSRWLNIRRVLNLTNATVQVTIEGKTLSITEWIAFRNTGGNLLISTYSSLNTSTSDNHFRIRQAEVKDGDVGIRRMYDEKKKNEAISEVEDILDKVDSSLEMVNATTDLVEDI
jgi:hypothetical protein